MDDQGRILALFKCDQSDPTTRQYNDMKAGVARWHPLARRMVYVDQENKE